MHNSCKHSTQTDKSGRGLILLQGGGAQIYAGGLSPSWLPSSLTTVSGVSTAMLPARRYSDRLNYRCGAGAGANALP